ncbi:MAG TPA: amidohydrolase family protein [Paracoccaceae bacterium]
MEILDAHCHFWMPARGDYGWLDAAGPDLASLRRDFLPDELAAQSPAEVIAVQAAPTEAETQFLLSLAAQYPWIRGVVGWVDLADPAAAGRLAAMAANPRLVGLRPMLQDLPTDDWLLRHPHPATLSAMKALGLRFDALVQPRHLEPLARFTAQHPDLPIVIDHAAKPHLATGRDSGWAEGMARLAGHRNVSCKLSGLLTELAPEALAQPETALAVLRPLFARLLDWFGPARLIWGSDWPVLTLAASYGAWRALTEALLDGLSADEKRAILGGNARRFYGLDGGLDGGQEGA